MSISVAEYLGQRTDAPTQIKPIPLPFSQPIPLCPFNKLPCKKMNMKTNSKFPVCSLRRNGEIYIVCENRLVSTTSEHDLPMSPYQADTLHKLAQEVFHSTIAINQLAYKAEVRMKSGHVADYTIKGHKLRFQRSETLGLTTYPRPPDEGQ